MTATEALDADQVSAIVAYLDDPAPDTCLVLFGASVHPYRKDAAAEVERLPGAVWVCSPAGRYLVGLARAGVALGAGARVVVVTARAPFGRLAREGLEREARSLRRHRRDRVGAGTCRRTSGAGLSRTTASASGSNSASSGSHHAPSSSKVAVSPAPFWMRLVAVRKHKPLSIGPRALPVI